MKIHYFGILFKALQWTDIALLNVSFIVACLLRFDSLNLTHDSNYNNLLLVTNLVWIFTTYVLRTYASISVSFHFREQILMLFKVLMLHGGLMMAFLYLGKNGEDYSRSQFLLTYVLFVTFSACVRYCGLLFLQFGRRAGYNYNRYAIIGKGSLATLINKYYDERKELGYQFYGMLELNSGDKAQTLESVVKDNKLDYLYCCLSEMNDEQVRDIIRIGECQKTQIRLIPDFRGFMTNMAKIEYHDIYPIIQVNTKPFSSVNEQTIKRIFDLAFSAIVIIAGAPVFLIIAAAVKISSKGPVIFKQERSGQWGEIFQIYKFRSMYTDAHKTGLKHSQGITDSRITPVGRFLRKTRLDELPQFFNVLKGDMSVVGPRPLFKYDVDMLMEAEPHDFQRLLTVKPGITSTGQIHVGYADNVAKNLERLKYDLKYLQSYSLLDDVHLIFRTVQVMLSGRGV
ncbi:sugar transferase [Dyadobacter flavalbus]|uniref:Sugar transferase n=1 Tax=Dyadobacter flavalbus TaxID=2579942 RepID=A0A5M8QQG0_9BACT|nr:sugar transferase [Dyadobacter flavalbus]KAA6436753.1 sugar transferase [Dyadobacter flavalbus]